MLVDNITESVKTLLKLSVEDKYKVQDILDKIELTYGLVTLATRNRDHAQGRIDACRQILSEIDYYKVAEGV